MKIVVKNACKRKPGYMYHIDSEGNLIEEAGPIARHAAAAIDSDEGTFPRKSKLSYNDNVVLAQGFEPKVINKLSSEIRTKVLQQLLALLLIQDISIDSIMNKIKVSKRTAYDYLKTIRIIKGEV